jgi:2-haloacid dehalogenase
MDAVKALVFDVFGTVVDWREGIARDAAPFLARHGRPDLDPRAFADAWRKRYQPAMEECRTGRRPFTRLDVLHRENLENVLRDNGMDPTRIGEAELDAMNRAWHRLDPWPEAVAGLTRLRRRFVLAPLSNGNVSLLLNMAKRAAIPWDAILGAEVAGAYKPQPEAYLRTADILGIRPGELCLGGRPQRRPPRRAQSRPRHRLRPAADGARPGADDRPRPGGALGRGRGGFPGPGAQAGMLTPPAQIAGASVTSKSPPP